jgi:general secretion pathway protein B
LAIQPTPGSAPPPAANLPAPAAATPPFGAANRNAPPAAAAAAASTAQAPSVRGLPPDAPKLVISGSVYSPDPAQRRLIVNGQIVREGEDLGQGVVVQEVKHEGAVLGYKGSNYHVTF